jgi:hypothetical protein
LPFQQQQQQQTTYAPFSLTGSQEAKDFLNAPLDFGGGNYGGNAYQDYTNDAYKDIKNDFKFNIDPGAGRRTDLAEQAAQNRWNSSFFGGMPQEYRQLLRDSETRQIRGQGAAEAQQAEYQRQNAQQQADYQSSLARAGMRDAGELNRARLRDESERARAGMLDQAASQQTLANLGRYERLLPQILQTGGNSASSGYNTQIMPGQQGWFGSLLQGAGSAIGGLGAGGYL